MASVPCGDAPGGGEIYAMTFQLKIDNFTSSEFPVCSEPRVAQSLPGTWRIIVTKDKVKIWDGSYHDYVGLYLQSDINSSASCRVSAHLSILKKGGTGGRIKRILIPTLYSQNRNTHGFPRFIPWTDLIRTEAGFIDDDQITFEVYVKKVDDQASDENHPNKKLKLSNQLSVHNSSGALSSVWTQPLKLKTKTPIYANSNSALGLRLTDPYSIPETNNNSIFEFFKKVHVYSNVKGIDTVTVWAKFFTFSLKAQPQFNPYEASDSEVADFAHYLDYTETLNRNYLEALAAAMDKYHKRKDGFFKDVNKVLEMIKGCVPSFHIAKTKTGAMTALTKLSGIPLKSKPWYYTYNNVRRRGGDGLWETFFTDSQECGYDPFKASPNQVCQFINDLIKAKPSRRSSLLSHHSDYLSFVRFIIDTLDDILEISRGLNESLKNSGVVSNLMRAVLACDEGILTNPTALSLLPKHNYVRMRNNSDEGEERFWNMKLIELALEDIREERISVHKAATEFGVTPEMMFSKLHSDDYDRERFPSLNEFLEHERGPTAKFWRKYQVKELLIQVRNKEETLASAAAKIGVSRAEIEKRCGGLKSKEEIEAEEELERIERVNKQEEAAKKRIKRTDLDKQIHISEKNEDDLCDYEKQRLENLRERKAMMEKLDIVGDKLEIRRLNKVVRKPATPKVELPRRERSTRIQRLKENRRFTSDTSSPYQDMTMSRETPVWFGNIFNLRDESFRHVVPKFDLNSKELIEITSDYRSSKTFFESITMESKCIKKKHFHDDDLDWSLLDSSEEYIVSTSAITALDSLGDFVIYGTEAGGVGVLLAQRSLTFRPHSGPVTELLTSGARILSSSLDGTVRRLDLVKQVSSLEYCWEATDETKKGVYGMRASGDHSFLMDCNDKMVQLDLRSKRVKVLFDIQPFSPSDLNTRRVDIEPVAKNLFSVCRDNTVMVWDFRKTGPPVHSFESQDSPNLASWSPDGSCLLISNDEGMSRIFDVTRHLKLSEDNLKYSPDTGNLDLPSLSGDLWCSWQGSTVFQMSRKKAKDVRRTTLSALECQR